MIVKSMQLLISVQKIRRLAGDLKALAAEEIGPAAQAELMQIERLADVVVGRIVGDIQEERPSGPCIPAAGTMRVRYVPRPGGLVRTIDSDDPDQ